MNTTPILMPGMSGFDVFKWIRQQPGFKALRVAMPTSSESPSEIKMAHGLGANIFLTKPVQLERLIEITLNEHLVATGAVSCRSKNREST